MHTARPRLAGLPKPLCAAALVFLAAALPAQQSGLQFEVASVRPADFPSDSFAAGFRAGTSSSPCTGGALTISGTRVSITRAAICDIVRLAYDVKGYQVIGVPGDLGYSGLDKIAPLSMAASIAEAAKHPVFFYDVQARAPGSDPPAQDQAREMLRALLADRFHLQVHRGQRELSYYALVPARNGPRLTPAVEGCKVEMSTEFIGGCGQTVEQVARRLNALADKTVVDQTGISGKFDFRIPIDPAQRRDFSAMAGAVQEALKLKVEPRKGPLEVLIVDHVERPSEN